jgi:polymorphic membrane protein
MASLRPPGRTGTLVGSRLRFCVLALLSISILASNGDARTWYVRPDGTGDAATIRAAIDSAAAGDELLLAAGSYTWTSEQASPFSMLTINKPNLTLRSETGSATTILDAEFQWRIMRCRDVGGLVIDGLTFQNGASKIEIGGNEGSDTHGGAIYVTGNSQPVIRNCVFRNNSAIGGTSYGGAIQCDVAAIDGCEFLNNQAGDVTKNGFGGAVSCGAGQITNCAFRQNLSLGDGSAAGGAISCANGTIRQCIFEGNLSGAHVSAGGGAIVETGNGLIASCRFSENRVSASDMRCSGGAVSINRGTVSGTLFLSNEADANFFAVPQGGAISCGPLTVTGCIFLANTAHVRPAGSGFGGAIRTFDVTTVENCTLLGNSGGDPSGVGGIFMGAPGNVRSTILAYTQAGQGCSGEATWSCSDLFGNAQGDAICGTDSGGNFTSDPQFCAADPIGTQNVLIQSDSPCAPGNHPQGQPCGLIGAAPVGCGTVSAQRTTWSRFKSLYR